MLQEPKRNFLLGLALTAGVLLSCNGKTSPVAAVPPTGTPTVAASTAVPPQGRCYVHLFDDDRFQDDNLIVAGPGAFANLRSLPNSQKDWDDEADSMKIGPGATVVVWEKENYQGDSTVFQAGAQVAKLKVEIRSMKIRCQ